MNIIYVNNYNIFISDENIYYIILYSIYFRVIIKMYIKGSLIIGDIY